MSFLITGYGRGLLSQRVNSLNLTDTILGFSPTSFYQMNEVGTITNLADQGSQSHDYNDNFTSVVSTTVSSKPFLDFNGTSSLMWEFFDRTVSDSIIHHLDTTQEENDYSMVFVVVLKESGPQGFFWANFIRSASLCYGISATVSQTRLEIYIGQGTANNVFRGQFDYSSLSLNTPHLFVINSNSANGIEHVYVNNSLASSSFTQKNTSSTGNPYTGTSAIGNPAFNSDSQSWQLPIAKNSGLETHTEIPNNNYGALSLANHFFTPTALGAIERGSLYSAFQTEYGL